MITPQKLTFARIQSPSSMNLYKQCPRRYYYQYIEKLPGSPSIHLTRGRIAHSVLEDFFKLEPEKLSKENFDFVLKIFLHDLLSQHWKKGENEFRQLKMDKALLDFYHIETKGMISKWANLFLEKVGHEMKQGFNLSQAFKRLTPITEKQYKSEKYGVRGFIDAIHEKDGEIVLVDYKTSKHAKISDAYRLQLALYAMMYLEKHDEMPTKVGIDFLKHGEMYLDVNKELVDLAKLECELIHMNTRTTEIEDYPKKKTPLCKWRTGQCDFYDLCNGCK